MIDSYIAPCSNRVTSVRQHRDQVGSHREWSGTIVDYLGTHRHLALDIDCWVDDDGAMCLRSGAQRFYEGRVFGKLFGYRGRFTVTGSQCTREQIPRDVLAGT